MNQNWMLGVYSSGGSAHERAMKELCRRAPHLDKINILSSSCTFFPSIGRLFASMWNRAQRRGSVKTQVLLGLMHGVVDQLFYLPTRQTIYKACLKQGCTLPQRLSLTSPFFLSAICDAVLKANAQSASSEILTVDLYMIEPPTDEARYYFEKLRRLSNRKRELIRLFAQHPSGEDCARFGGEERYWREKTGLRFEQIIFDPPVKEEFKNGAPTLPLPGQPVTFAIRGYAEPFQIASRDRVGLVMLGGVPTPEAVISYVEVVIDLSLRHSAPAHGGRNFLFVACGHYGLGLFQTLSKKLHREALPSPLTIVPFISQPAEKIFARADVTITRTGGMTSLEIMELKKRVLDNKQILIHAQLPRHFSGRDQEEMIRVGIPLWEGGNARYLLKSIPDALVVSPKNCAEPIARKFYPKSA